MMEYKGGAVNIELDEGAKLFHGGIAGINAVISFQAKDATTLKQKLKESIDDCLD